MAAFLDSAFLSRLERLSLEVRRNLARGARGARTSREKGPGIAFADHRGYGPGDDLRHVDWALYGRLERLFVKLYEAEREATLHLAIDHSSSMGFGEPSKLALAARIAGALGYIALADEDRVVLSACGARIDQRFGPVRGKRQSHALFARLGALEAEGETDLEKSLVQLASSGRPGLAVVLSDWLSDSDWRRGLGALLAARFDVFAIQVLAPEDLDPELDGELALVDSETGETVGVTVTEAVRARYRRAVEEHCSSIERWCVERGIGYLRAQSDAAFEDLVLRTLRRTPLIA